MRPTRLEVNLAQLKQNLQNIRAKVAPAKVLVVLKANAYGHGVDGVAPFIAPFADYIGVAIPEEGLHLRRLGISTPILVMGGTLAEQLPDFLEYDLTLAGSSIPLLEAAEQLAAAQGKTLKVHLKIDTGMERIGAREYEAEALIQKSLACRHLDVEGIFTHFANSEETTLRGIKQAFPKTSALLQLERFEETLALYDKLGAPRPRLRHAANSGATLLLPESYYEMVRPGVLFYGIYPARDIERTIEVQPALTWKSRVVFSKITQAGRGVSYGSLWSPSQSSRVVTVPCGYADGYFRCMSGKPQVLIHGKRYPQVGRICMDQFMVNVGDDDVQVGDEVILMGGGIAPEELADWANTNEYEAMTNVSARVPRVFLS